MWILAYAKDGEFFHFENGKPVIHYKGDEILKTFILDSKEAERSEELLSAFGDGWYDGFLKAKKMSDNGEDLDEFDILRLSEDSENIAKLGSLETALLEKIKVLEQKLEFSHKETEHYKSKVEELEKVVDSVES